MPHGVEDNEPTPRSLRSLVATGSWTLGVNLGAKAQALAILIAGGVSGGVKGVGVAAAGYASAMIGSAIADFGYSPEATRFIAQNPVRLSVETILRGARFRAPVALVAGFALAVATLPGSFTWWLILAANSLAGFYVQLLSQVLYGLFRHRAAATALFATRTLSAISLPYVAGQWGTTGLLVALAITDLTCAVVLAFAVRSAIESCPNGPLAGPVLRSHYWLGLGAVVSAVTNRRDSALVAVAASTEVAGVYTIASQMQNAVTTLALVPSGAISSHVAESRPGGALRRTVTRMVVVVAGLTAIGGAAVVLLSWVPWLSPYIGAGSDLETLRPALALTMVGAPFGVAGGLYLTATVGRGRHRAVGLAWLAIGVVGVPVIVGLAAVHGVIGAAIGAVVRDLITLVVGLYCWRHAGLRDTVRLGK